MPNPTIEERLAYSIRFQVEVPGFPGVLLTTKPLFWDNGDRMDLDDEIAIRAALAEVEESIVGAILARTRKEPETDG